LRRHGIVQGAESSPVAGGTGLDEGF